MGRRCDKCALNHWDLNSWFGCKPCDCDTINTHLNLNECDLISGQCFCQIGRAGRRCDECPRGSWGMPRSGCKSNWRKKTIFGYLVKVYKLNF